tara:strand:+ start:2005 stop:2259 length:255 start_codon:yes stop_codon:yes gene_type:complete
MRVVYCGCGTPTSIRGNFRVCDSANGGCGVVTRLRTPRKSSAQIKKRAEQDKILKEIFEQDWGQDAKAQNEIDQVDKFGDSVPN